MNITEMLLSNFPNEIFSLEDAYKKVLNEKKVNPDSIRARIYEAIDKGILQRISRGIFAVDDTLVIKGDGRDLSFIGDSTIDAIITDHPYDIPKSHKGGSRNFTDTYDCFKYTQEDFNEKARVLKDGHFLVEFIPEENGDNWEYLYQIKEMAKKAGFVYYAKVPWKKGNFVSNCGRKSKNTEEVLMFTKGPSRKLRVDAKKNKADNTNNNFMSGANGMLPTVFDIEKTNKKLTIHQAEKPVELLEIIVNYVTKVNEIVLDQFAGSGSLAVASKNMNRSSISIEMDDSHFENIKNRLKKEFIN